MTEGQAENKNNKSENKQNSKPRTSQNSNKSNQSKSGDNKRRMFIDASKHEETRVVVAQSGKLIDFEVESLLRRQIKGNIYLAKVTRVEPSLQAAFVNYGGNRHGFLPFSEIHPDYYRIPIADRERLMAEQEELERKALEEAAALAAEEDKKAAEEENVAEIPIFDYNNENNVEEIEDDEEILEAGIEAGSASTDNDGDGDDAEVSESDTELSGSDERNNDDNRHNGRGKFRRRGNGRKYSASKSRSDRVVDDEDITDVEPFWKRIRRAYKIQEVIKRGQIMLIQVGKEERGNKGAAVTTYITLPGRYCVLMPNTPQSGGVSRKIANFKDRKRMREILKDLDVPQGMSVILRTAGTTRTKAEIKRDLDYLMRLWNNARDLTMKSSAPALINEEGSLIKRAIRDIYNKDIDEVFVAGEEGYKTARDMMKMLMPTHVKKVNQYKDKTPLFIKEKLEQQIEAMHSPQVELKSGGYLVINPTEALVSIDVNSGRSTKERNIDDTALRTNIEAAEEIARQLKLRDLGGLVVIDFIDMENRRNNGKVERAMRDALADDRARIQIGRISSFGLMEMSRQRLHPSLTEAHFETCPHCSGRGIVKTVDTMALTILRAIEETALVEKDMNLTVTMANDVALYLFNHHRLAITDLETRYAISVIIAVDKVDDPRGFDITTIKKPKINEDDIDMAPAATDVELNQAVLDNMAPEIIQSIDNGDDKPRRRSRGGRNRNRNKNPNQAEKTDLTKETETPEKPEITQEAIVSTDAEDTPKKKRGGRPSKKKIEIAEVSETVEKIDKKADAKPAPTNDNGNADKQNQAEINKAAREAEKINEAPKSKKKGWWNKITN